jgi:hypothetical protein
MRIVVCQVPGIGTFSSACSNISTDKSLHLHTFASHTMHILTKRAALKGPEHTPKIISFPPFTPGGINPEDRSGLTFPKGPGWAIHPVVMKNLPRKAQEFRAPKPIYFSERIP